MDSQNRRLTTVKTAANDSQNRRRPYAHMYKTALWKKLRIVRLSSDPVCKMCYEDGRITPANVVDHVIPHRGNWNLFSSLSNTQSLCSSCHSSTKQKIEKSGKDTRIGIDGWPKWRTQF